MWLLRQAQYAYSSYAEKRKQDLLLGSHPSTHSIATRYETIKNQKKAI